MVKYYKKYTEADIPEPQEPQKKDDKTLAFDDSIFMEDDGPVNEMSALEASIAIEDSNKAIENHDLTESTKSELSPLEEALNPAVKNFLTTHNIQGLKNSVVAQMMADELHGNKDSYQTILSKKKAEVMACQAEYQKNTNDFGPAPLPSFVTNNATTNTVAQSAIPEEDDEEIEEHEFTDEEKEWMANSETGYDSDEDDKKRQEFTQNGGVLPSEVDEAVNAKFQSLKMFVKTFINNLDMEHRLHVIFGGPGIGKTVEIFKTIAELTGKPEDEVVQTLKAKKPIIYSGAKPYAWQSHTNPEQIKYITGASSAELDAAIAALFTYRKDYILIFDDYDAWIKRGSQKIPNLFKAVFNSSPYLDKVSWRSLDLAKESMSTHIHINKNRLKEGVFEVTINDSETFTENLSKKKALKLCETFGVEVKPDSWLALHEAIGLDDDEADDDIQVFGQTDTDDSDANPADPQATAKGMYDQDYAAEQAYFDAHAAKKKATAKQAIPEDFYFQSRCLFITNMSQDKMDPAVFSRIDKYDMGTFTAPEFFSRLKQIINHLGKIDNIITENGLQVAIRNFTKGFIFQLVYNPQEMRRKYRKFNIQGLPVYARQFRTVGKLIVAVAIAVDDYRTNMHPVKRPNETDDEFYKRIVLEAINPTPMALGGTNPNGAIQFTSLSTVIASNEEEE